MPNEMSSWKPFASAAFHSVKDYIAQRDIRGTLPSRKLLQPGDNGYVAGQNTTQSWSNWAGQKIKRNPNSDTGRVGTDHILLFPGWASKRYLGSDDVEPEPFSIDVFISGYASNRRPPELATRSQRAFLRLAKGFASLPKLPGESPPPSRSEIVEESRLPLSPSTEELLASIQLPPRPMEITEENEVKALEKYFRRAEISNERPSDSDTESYGSSRSSSPAPSEPTPSSVNSNDNSTLIDIRRLHANLEARLQPFWSSTLSARSIRVSVFSPPLSHHKSSENDIPVSSQEVTTAVDGSFQAKFCIPWEDICRHPGALHIALNPDKEHLLVVTTELLPPPIQPQSNTQAAPSPSTNPLAISSLSIPLTYSDVRVISDIDDTVKFSNILSGARAVFYNVFVKELSEIVIPGMGDWYSEMWRRGVQFHYVSNGPFELLPIVNEFLQVSQLPPGSIKLKSYAGRSLFNGLLSAPATRKRAGIVDVLDAFPSSRFFLVGDSGEQDLELYTSLALERPDQVLAIFVRDANTYTDGVDSVEDPTGLKDVDMFLSSGRSSTQSTRDPFTAGETTGTPLLRAVQKRTASLPRKQLSLDIPPDYFTSNPAPVPVTRSSMTALTEEPGSYIGTPRPTSATQSPRRTQQNLSESEKKRTDLQERIHRSRLHIPARTPLRIFRKPEECVEAREILDKLHVGGTT